MFWCIALLLSASIAPADDAGVRAARTAQNAAIAAGDLDRAASFWTEDVTVRRGRYSAQWVKRGGRWLIRSEVFVALTCRSVGCESVAVP